MLRQDQILTALKHDGNTWNGILNYGTKIGEITVSFFSQLPSYYQNITLPDTLTDVDTGSIHPVDKVAFTSSLNTWKNVANINFNILADNTSTATLAVVGSYFKPLHPDTDKNDKAYVDNAKADGRTADANGQWHSYAATDYIASSVSAGSNTTAGDMWFNTNPATPEGVSNTQRIGRGQDGFETFVHEIGHALGLDHPLNPDTNKREDKSQNQMLTVMSYQKMDGTKGTQHITLDSTGAQWFPSKPMLYDIYAIQTMYGVNTKTGAADDTYYFGKGADAVQAIWDAGKKDGDNDTIDASAYGVDDGKGNLVKGGVAITEGVTIDLRPGHFSFVGSFEQKSTSLIAIAFQPNKDYENNWIENAIGTEKNDVLIGNGYHGANNDKGNKLEGGLGDDIYYIEDDGSHDSIIDSDGSIFLYAKGKMPENPRQGSPADRIQVQGDYIQDKNDTNKWVKTDGNTTLTLVHDNSWHIDISHKDDTSTVTQIDLGSSWTSGKFGITTQDNLALNILNFFIGDAAADDSFTFDASNQSAQGLGGQDMLIATYGGGNNKLEGGADSDVLLGGSVGGGSGGGSGGNGDLLYANTEQSFSDALAAGETGTGTGLRGDLLSGGAGNDELYGSNGNDALAGGKGDDILVGGLGDDVLLGDANFNNASINWSINQSHQAINDGGGHIHSLNVTDVSIGYQPANQGDVDIIYGGAGADFVSAGAGNDMIDAGADNDVVFGGEDNDVIEGQGGNDILIGDDYGNVPYGNDTLFGGDGDDKLYGTGGDDYLDGGDGNDVLYGDHNGSDISTDGQDILNGGLGNDWLYGGGNNDVLSGDEGDDHLLGEIGDDELDGGTGNDLLLGNEGDDYLNGGTDNDELQGGEGDDILVGGTGTDTLFGGNDDDTLWGSEDADFLYGDVGNDYLDGGADNDELQGGAGDDTLDGGTGADTLMGGAGDDTYLNVTGGDTINDTEGHSTIQLAHANYIGTGGLSVERSGDQSQYVSLDIALDDGTTLNIQDAFFGTDAALQFADGTQLDLETLVGTTLTTSLNLHLGDNDGKLYGGAVTDLLYGGSGDDSLSGAGGNDGLYGGAGNDTLSGGTGADVLHGGTGNDSLRGGEGDDNLQGGEGDDTLEGGAGQDDLYGEAGNDRYVLDADAGSDRIIDTQGNNIIRLTGDLANTLTASLNSSTLNLSANGVQIASIIGGLDSYRFEFDDGTQLSLSDFLLNYQTDPLTLYGDDNDNTLYGGKANDTLTGNGGNDTLDGGRGNDTLEGGAGNDSYLFSTSSGHDVITWQHEDAVGDRIFFASDIQYNDLTIEGLANGDLLISVNNHDASLTLTNWFNTTAHPTQFQFADGTSISAADIATWQIAPITGTAGDDVLIGSDYNDVILGNAGNDLVDGGYGNDTLQGGTGRDSYVLQLGNTGYDTVIETGGETSVVKLTNASIGDLLAQRSGNDLLLSVLGSDADSLLLKDYYDHSSEWAVVDYRGVEQSLSDALTSNENRRASMDKVALLEEEFTAVWRTAHSQSMGTQLADGVFELKPGYTGFYYVQNQLTNLSGAAINSYSYHQNYVYQDFQYNPWIVTTLNIQAINSNDEEIDLNSTSQSTHSNVPMDVVVTDWNQSVFTSKRELFGDGHYEFQSKYISLPPNMNGMAISGYNVSVMPTDVPGQFLVTGYFYVPPSLIGYEQSTNITANAQIISMTPGQGTPIDITNLIQDVFNQNVLPQQMTLVVDRTEQTFTLTTLNAGDGDNNIYVSGNRYVRDTNSFIIHAGGGNDVVSVNTSVSRGGDFPERAIGNIFIDGGAGNDTISVHGWETTDDILMGGTGRNYLSGGGGNDWYILSAEGGWDWIDTSPTILQRYHNIYTNSDYTAASTVELSNGITREMLSTSFGQAVVGGSAQSALNLAWNGENHASILLNDTGHSDSIIRFADGSTVTLNDLIASTAVTDNVGYYSDNVRVSIATSAAINLVGQGDDNVFVVEGDGITHVTTGTGRNLLQDFNPDSTCVLNLTAGSETWFNYNTYYHRAIANLQISGSAQASVHLSFSPSYGTLLRDGQDLVITDSDFYTTQQLRFTDWFAESTPHQVDFYSGWGSVYSLQKLVDIFTTRNGGTIQNGSSIQFDFSDVYMARLNDWSVSDYQPLGTDWQLPLTRVMFTPDMGNITAQDYGAIVFDHTLSSTDVSYLKSGNDLVITSASGTDSLRLQDWYVRSDQPEAWFTGEVWSYQDLSEQGITLEGTHCNDSLIAPDDYGWHLQGLAGNDILQGNTGADSLDGGSGNDTLLGGAGSDQYYFGLDSGSDTITDQTLTDSGDINTVYIDGVLPDNIIVNIDNHHIILSIVNTADKLTIQWDSQNGYLIQEVVFSDGTIWDAATLEAMAVPLNVAPLLINPLSDQQGVENHLFSFQIPADTFHDPDAGDVLHYTAMQANGSPLPVWLSFNPTTATFTGKPGLNDAGTLALTVTAIDQGGLSVSSTFNFNIANLIEGTVYSDNIVGTAGNDYISTGAGNDTVNGGDGNDVIIGGTGSDLLAGGAGNDTFLIDGNDSGYDRFQGDAGFDLILGGAGDDTLRVNNFSGSYTVEKIDGGAGVNTLAGTQYGDTIDLSATELVNISAIDGGIGNDTIAGSAGNDVIIGGTGSDLLAGGAGNDTFLIDGNDSGYDRFQGDAGFDLILGGAGDDTIRVNNFSGSYTVEKIDGGAGVNTLAGTQYGDTIDLSATELVNINAIDGGIGNDTITGSAGNDVIIGGEGSDTLIGNLGQDKYDLTETTAATDIVRIATGDSLVNSYDSVQNFKLGTGSSNTGVDKLDLTSTLIAANTAAVDGVDSGTILSHHINNGIISFDDVNNYTSPMTITDNDLANVCNYLQTNITGNKTVAFACSGNTFIFQDGGVTDTLVELVGVTANSINTTGAVTGSIWIS